MQRVMGVATVHQFFIFFLVFVFPATKARCVFVLLQCSGLYDATLQRAFGSAAVQHVFFVGVATVQLVFVMPQCSVFCVLPHCGIKFCAAMAQLFYVAAIVQHEIVCCHGAALIAVLP